MSLRDHSYLVDILEAGQLMKEFLEGIDKAAFENSPMVQAAVIRQLEVIGEATKRLSEEFRVRHPEIPWRNMAGIRDILIHAYDHVDIDQVWTSAQNSIPDILDKIKTYVQSSE